MEPLTTYFSSSKSPAGGVIGLSEGSICHARKPQVGTGRYIYCNTANVLSHGFYYQKMLRYTPWTDGLRLYIKAVIETIVSPIDFPPGHIWVIRLIPTFAGWLFFCQEVVSSRI